MFLDEGNVPALNASSSDRIKSNTQFTSCMNNVRKSNMIIAIYWLNYFIIHIFPTSDYEKSQENKFTVTEKIIN